MHLLRTSIVSIVSQCDVVESGLTVGAGIRYDDLGAI